MAAKKKSTIQIPYNKKFNQVPHWAEDRNWAVLKVAECVELLAAGFVDQKYSDGRPVWSSEDSWRRSVQTSIDRFSYEWSDPKEFKDTFKIIDYGRGRSAAYLMMKSTTTGLQCVMMMKDMTHMIMTAVLNQGVVTGRWIFGKRGSNYGIQYLGAAIDEKTKIRNHEIELSKTND